MKQHHQTLLAATILFCGIAAQAAPGPFDAITGKWTNDVKMSATQSNTGKANTFWVGLMYGQISSTGKFVFRVANGCQIEGIVAPSSSIFQHTGNMTGCADKDLEGVYSGYLSLSGTTLNFSGSSSKIFSGASTSYSISSTLVRY
ncbi:hypothetical protein [Rhodoferax antarcticus]|uniref:hypothetical protein n=1 Tax=Rhodoferax antarcticus TaxID=81479 RepID=UPI001115439C|nr:hypothetical protein [Rhodoferax antarcticus]